MDQHQRFDQPRNGHEYHLYVYEDVKNVPAATTLRDGNEILPASEIFQYQGRPSYAGFANFFRYKLLLERGITYESLKRAIELL